MPSGLPGNVAVVAVDSRTIQITWEPLEEDQQNGVIDGYLVMIMVQQTRRSLTLNSSSPTLTVSGLHPAYDYSVEVAAVTIGVGSFSSPVAITTPDDGELEF